MYSENLDAKFSGTSSDLTGAGSISELAAGGANSSGLSISLHSGVAGSFTGTGTIALTSDGSTIDTLGTTALKAETVTVSGALFNYATAVIAPRPVSFGEHHVGDTLSQILTISNGAAAGSFSENLDISFSGSSSDLTTSGSISELAAGSTNASSLDVVLASGTAGSHSGTATLAAVSDGSTIDTLGTTVLAAQTLSVSSTLYNYATASTAAPDPINFGIVHVGQTISHFITIANKAATGIYSENLDSTFTGTTGDFTTTGAISELAAGKTSSGALDVSLQTGTAGTFDGTTTLGLTSDGAGIDTLGTTALAGQTVTLEGTVNNYATAAIETISGPGTLTGGGNTYALNLGSVTKGSAALTEDLGILNSATGPADNLSGTFIVSGASEIGHSGFSTFSGVAAGEADTSPMLTLSTGTVGTFTETIYLEASGSNASGYSGTLAHETLIVTGTVTAAGQVEPAVADIPATATKMAIDTAPARMSFISAFSGAADNMVGPTGTPLTGRAAMDHVQDFRSVNALAKVEESAWSNFLTAKTILSNIDPVPLGHGIATMAPSGIVTSLGLDSFDLHKTPLSQGAGDAANALIAKSG